jgi:predicted metalloprotease with PDZ domain
LPKGYNEQDILDIMQVLTDKSYHDWWERHVHGTGPIDFDILLKQAGLVMSYQKKTLRKKGNNKKDELNSKAWTGIKTKNSASGLEVTSVEKNSPAWQAGLTLDDIIIAVDGLRIVDKDLNTRLKNFKVNQVINITFFRRDELMSKKVTLAATAKNKLTIVPLPNASRKQKAFFKEWTGLDFPKD